MATDPAIPDDRPRRGHAPPRPPVRVEGPTPAGGAYAIAYYGPGGRIAEVVEFDQAGEPIRRTYCVGTASPAE